MKKIFRNSVSILLILAMFMLLLPVWVFALEDSFEEEYELRILTFEDEGNDNYWSSLIDEQYGGKMLYGENWAGVYSQEEAYKWHDSGHTELSHTIPYNYGAYNYWGGGHAISNYASTDFEYYGDSMSQLTVFSDDEWEEGVLERTGGGNNDSDNFVVHFGYMDGSGFNGTENLSALSFADGKARVIDHMYVNNTAYFINCVVFGDEFTRPMEEDDWAKIVATGYNGDSVTGTAEFYLAEGYDFILKWTPWDLSALGKVTSVEFNIESSVYGDFGMSLPAYFAYDDVAVRFERTSVNNIYVSESETVNTYDYCYFVNASDIVSGKAIIALYSGEKIAGIDVQNIKSGDNDIFGSVVASKKPNRYKIMIWNGLDNPTPLCNAVEDKIN